MVRNTNVQRATSETDIRLSLNLDGSGVSQVESGIGFFDHMLTAFTRHGQFDLDVKCRGDLEVDAHHTVEDIGICLGQAFDETLGDKSGITRFGNAVVPMDEALARAIVDLSGRPYLVYEAELEEATVGTFPTELGAEFFRSLADHGRFNLHIDLLRGSNAHHCLEAIFKAVARALRQAVAMDAGLKGIPSTKGVL
jgi:imidazoleglycerol-phosphate dehydratase